VTCAGDSRFGLNTVTLTFDVESESVCALADTDITAAMNRLAPFKISTKMQFESLEDTFKERRLNMASILAKNLRH
jgi:hypothetical protein